MKGITTIADEAAKRNRHPVYIRKLSEKDPQFPKPIRTVGITRLFRTGDMDRYFADRKRRGITREKK